MKVNRWWIRWGACAGIAAGLMLVVPQAGHAVTSALVQVAQPIAAAPSKMVILKTPNATPLSSHEGIVALARLDPATGLGISAWTVPVGQTFVVTEMEGVTTAAGGAQLNIRTRTPSGYASAAVLYLPTKGTQQLHFTSSGIVFPEGTSVFADNAWSTYADMTVRGYLTAN